MDIQYWKYKILKLSLRTIILRWKLANQESLFVLSFFLVIYKFYQKHGNRFNACTDSMKTVENKIIVENLEEKKLEEVFINF